MRLKIFSQPCCPKCPAAKKLGQEIEKEGKLKVDWFDLSEVDGLAEAAFYQVMSTPSLILLTDQDEIVAEWRGKAPSLRELESKILGQSEEENGR